MVPGLQNNVMKAFNTNPNELHMQFQSNLSQLHYFRHKSSYSKEIPQAIY
jgi:hypothetical protein